MNWQELIEQRYTTFAWREDEIPSKDLIVESLDEVYDHIPSKNLQFPYQVRLWRNDNEQRRKSLMSVCHRNESLDVDQDRGNPQVLAPWLLLLNSRWVADRANRSNKLDARAKLDGFGKGQKRTDSKIARVQENIENIEIGIFTAFITLSLANRGIQSGICQCCDFRLIEELFPIDHDERALDCKLVIGVGYGKDRKLHHEYFDPRVNRMKKIPYPTYYTADILDKPKFNEIIIIDNFNG